jgi:hypothetical protein
VSKTLGCQISITGFSQSNSKNNQPPVAKSVNTPKGPECMYSHPRRNDLACSTTTLEVKRILEPDESKF